VNDPAAAFPALLRQVLAGRSLGREEARLAFEAIMEGSVPPASLAAFLTALRLRGETREEINAGAEALRARMTRVPTRHPEVLDTCGTGGAAAGTFNISTLASLVVAAAGVPVAKHGNRSATRPCGSADLLESLGIRADQSAEEASASLDDLGYAFLFAPRLHPAMRHAAPVRRELGVRTVFNLIGPLANPAGARLQVLGVYDRAWVEPLAQVLADLGVRRALVVHGGGTDEIALHAPTEAAEVAEGRVLRRTVKPEDAGLEPAPLEAITGTTRDQLVALATRILQGTERGPRRDVVVFNAAAALCVAGRAEDLRGGALAAATVLDDGRAWDLVERLRQRSPFLGE
jgi:anthranilate phosphoribosyltransferase